MQNIVERAVQKSTADSFVTNLKVDSCCKNCGIAESRDDSSYNCYKFKKKISDAAKQCYCLYFIPYVFDDGEKLTPLQHLILKEDELSRPKINL